MKNLTKLTLLSALALVATSHISKAAPLEVRVDNNYLFAVQVADGFLINKEVLADFYLYTIAKGQRLTLGSTWATIPVIPTRLQEVRSLLKWT